MSKKEAKQFDSSIYHRMLEPSFLSKVVSIALSTSSLVFVIRSDPNSNR